MRPTGDGVHERNDRNGSPRSDETRHEIIRAAHRLLWERPFRDIAVRDLMAATSVGRSSFYTHFQDRYDLAAALLEEVDREITAATPELPGDAQFADQLDANLIETVAVWQRHGPVIRAIAEASSQDARLEHLYRSWFIQRSIDRTSNLVQDAQRRGRLPASVDAAEFSTLTTLAATAYMTDRLGRLPQAPGDGVADVLVTGFRALLGIPRD